MQYQQQKHTYTGHDTEPMLACQAATLNKRSRCTRTPPAILGSTYEIISLINIFKDKFL
jgi:hypothetical protein